MNKILRFSFVALMALVMGNVFAQKTVTIDFDNDYQALFPNLPGVSSGSNENYVADGDFKGITTSTPVDGVVVAIAPDEDAKTPSRIWSAAPRLRMYSGAFSVVSTGEPITKIEFTAHNTNFNLTATEGTLDERVWTGSTNTAIFMVSKNTQINKIEVTLGGGSDTPDTPDNPGAGKGLFSMMALTNGTFTESENQLEFDFEAMVDPTQGAGITIPLTGKYLFDFENNLCTACRISVTVPDETTAAAAYAVVMQEAEKEGYKDVKLEGTTLSASIDNDFAGVSKTVIKSMMKLLLNDEEGGVGTLESPLSPNQANIFAGTLQNKQIYDEDIYIKGKVAAITYPFDAEHGTATFNISIDGENDFTFLCYAVNYLENKAWVEGNTQIKVGDEVIICGKVTNYNGTPETSSKKAYIYSLNGVTKNEAGETPQPQVTTATCAEILAGADGTVYRVTGKCVEIANTTYGNWYLEDATGKVYIYGTLDAAGNTKNFESLGIEVGDEITVEGPRKTYKETVELVDVTVIAIKKGAEGGQTWDFTQWSAATISNLKADAAASKTSGWSDVEKAADAEAGADPTEASKDNCFWSVAEPNADGTLSANGVVIEELKGLVWNSAYSVKRSLAIAVNYPSTSLGDYAGPAYLWLGGGKNKIPCFTIPGVKAGSTITIDAESHKPSEGRGVELYTGVDADNLVDAATMIGDSFKPKTKESHSWTIENDCDVIVYNNNGCHIYKIEITSGASGIQVVKAAKAGNDFIYNLAGQRVDANYKGVVIKNGQKMIQK